MQTNVGLVDRVLRIVVGAALIAVALLVAHPYAWVGWIGVVPILTAIVGYCPAYQLIGLSTCPLKRE
ncbi:membrane protein [Thalassobaculum fulvum]|jgi:purine-cytosine permease-like protein|uniref:Membrane protein n=1 Tax=Thalassobaculum fulvum TaxID=1633335 RepID=A0A918XT14_9PROT|nr:DUF2892 domain-containing protein [Thalassobaculum fulvum]GHD53972.1 membrane protein [Thalassobaculum fulvum]